MERTVERALDEPDEDRKADAEDDMENCELTAKCSLHYTTDFRQEETENYAANRIVFTTNEEVQAFNDVAPGTMWIAEFDGLQFAFSSSSMRYRQANLWHYSGFALYADMQTQIIDRVQDRDLYFHQNTDRRGYRAQLLSIPGP